MENPQAHRYWASAEAARDRGEWDRAMRGYQRALELDPRHVPALLGRSTVLTRLGSQRAARDAVLAAFAAQPAHPALLYALAQRLRYFNEYQRLVECLEHPRFAADAPSDAIAKAAVMLSSIGAHEPAKRLADRGLRRDPRHAALLHVRGNLHLFDGEQDQAERCYDASSRADPRLHQNAWMRAGVRTQTPQSNHAEQLASQLQRMRPGEPGEEYLAYALHKELHDLGDYEGAWSALARGCAAKRRQLPYSLAQDAAMADALQAVCTPEFVATASSVPQPATPIFIVGMHRSGTTLLERMLAGHSQVADAGETYAFDAQMRLATDHASAGHVDIELIRRSADAEYDAVARGYAEAVPWLSRGKPFFTEKLPINFWHAGFIAKALPQARILHLLRDPMDTCFSNLRTLFGGVAGYSYDQDELGGFYLLYRRVMAHWRDVMPGRVLDIAYTDLVDDPGAVAARVAAHCGLRYEPGMVEVERTGGAVATASAALARQGIRRDRGQLWRSYERHLQPLQHALAPAYRDAAFR